MVQVYHSWFNHSLVEDGLIVSSLDYEQLCIGFCVNTSFRFSGINVQRCNC